MSISRSPRSGSARACGVGVLFNPALAEFVVDHADHLDYLAVIPDRFWIDRGYGAADRFDATPAGEEVLVRAADSLPIVLHGIGLSICSADIFDREYVDQLERWRRRYDSGGSANTCPSAASAPDTRPTPALPCPSRTTARC